MRNLLITIRYVGTAYCGYQVQQNGRSITAAVQDAIEAVFGARHDIKGCSRTDSGVHANMFCISFKTEKTIPCENIIKALNINLPADIAVYGCEEMPLDFHARYSCTGKEYIYVIDNSKHRNPFLADRAYHYPRHLDVQRMNTAAQLLAGTQDFKAFCSSGSKIIDTTRTVFSCSVEREGDLVTAKISGDGFLYNMVRIVAGTLIMISDKELPPQYMIEIIAGGDRKNAGITVPPHGLYLNEVYY